MIEIIRVLEYLPWTYQNSAPNARCSHTETFIIISGPPYRNSHNQMDYLLLDMRWHSRIEMYEM